MLDSTPALAAISGVGLLLGAGFALGFPLADPLDASGGQGPGTGASASSPEARSPDGRMTVDERERTHEGLEAHAPPFFASRVVTLQGDLTLAELAVTLANVDGDVSVTTGGEERWRLVANLTGYGPTPEEAREERDGMELAWSTGEPGGRHLVATVEHEDGGEDELADAASQEATLELRVPADVALGLSASSTNGAINVDGVEAAWLEASSTNGPLTVEAHGTTSVVLDATNGAIEAELAPGGDGSIEASSTNAAVNVSVPEGQALGYDATAASTDGRATIGLEDGETRRSIDGSRAVFRTDGFASRDVQTSVVLSSTNGDVHLGPAS